MTKKQKLVEVLRATPNILGTFDALMLLGHTMHEQNGRNYFVQIDWKNDCVILKVEVEQLQKDGCSPDDILERVKGALKRL